MKFGKQLDRHKIRGWDAFYIDYNGLKKSLKDRGSPTGDILDQEAQAPGVWGRAWR